MTTEFSCQTSDREALIREVCLLSPFGTLPSYMDLWPAISGEITNREGWQERLLESGGCVSWEDEKGWTKSLINIRPDSWMPISVRAGDHSLDLRYFLSLIRKLPIEVLCMASDFFDHANRLVGHEPLGWGCLFKGSGHDFFVSPRWLEHGPWLLERDEPNISYVQLYDLTSHGDAAWQQGRRAMERLANGFYSSNMITYSELRGTYSPSERSFTFLAVDRGITPSVMNLLCRLRAKRRADPSQPVERLVVTFTEERDARRHLHELWLREIECWALLSDGRRVRLDTDYIPPPRILPEWLELHHGLPASGPYAAVVTSEAPASKPGAGVGISATGFRLSLGLSSLTGPLTVAQRRQLVEALAAPSPLSIGDCPGRADGAGAQRAFAGRVEVGPSDRFDQPAAEAEQALAAAPFVVDVFLPPERVGLSLPAVLVSADFPSQAPIRPADLGPAAAGPGAALVGAMVLPVADVLARVSALNRQDLQCAESLLELCSSHRLVVVATERPTE